LAVSPESALAFQREVDEEVRREQVLHAARRYGLIAAVVVVLALAALGGWLWRQHHQRELAGREGEQLQVAYEAVSAGRVPQAQAALAPLTASGRPGYRALALFTQADLLLAKNDQRRAAAKFAVVASDEDVPPPLRNLALIRQTAAEFDQLRPQVVVNRLQPLATVGNPWFGSAGEMVAIAYLRMNRPDLAGPLFGRIAQAGDAVPASMRQRAVQMAGVLGVDAVATNEGKGTQ
jgi:hypothetical protein